MALPVARLTQVDRNARSSQIMIEDMQETQALRREEELYSQYPQKILSRECTTRCENREPPPHKCILRENPTPPQYLHSQINSATCWNASSRLCNPPLASMKTLFSVAVVSF